MRRAIDAGTMLGAVALAGGVLVLGVTLSRALRPEPAPPPENQGAAATIALAEPQRQVSRPTPSEPLSSRMILPAVNRAPFDPERQAPRQRYQLPGQQEEEMVAEEPPVELPPVPALRVLGTIAGAEGGIAVIQAEGESPQVVAVGEVIGGYRVASVEEKAVVVSLRDWQISLALEEGTPATAAQAGQNARRGRQGDEETRQQLETFVRGLQQRLGGGVQVVVEGGRAYLIGADGERRELQIPAALGRINRNITIRPPVIPPTVIPPTVIPPTIPPPGTLERQGSGDGREVSGAGAGSGAGAATEAGTGAGSGAGTEGTHGSRFRSTY